MQKVIPPRLVEPYLAGQRDIIAGYVYRVADCAGAPPDRLFDLMGLGYAGSELTPDAPEIFVLRWGVRDIDAYQIPHGPEMGGDWREHPPNPGNGSADRAAPEFFTDPMPIPVGAEIYRVTGSGEDFVARYDGRTWLRAVRQEG